MYLCAERQGGSSSLPHCSSPSCSSLSRSCSAISSIPAGVVDINRPEDLDTNAFSKQHGPGPFGVRLPRILAALIIGGPAPRHRVYQTPFKIHGGRPAISARHFGFRCGLLRSCFLPFHPRAPHRRGAHVRDLQSASAEEKTRFNAHPRRHHRVDLFFVAYHPHQGNRRSRQQTSRHHVLADGKSRP